MLHRHHNRHHQHQFRIIVIVMLEGEEERSIVVSIWGKNQKKPGSNKPEPPILSREAGGLGYWRSLIGGGFLFRISRFGVYVIKGLGIPKFIKIHYPIKLKLDQISFIAVKIPDVLLKMYVHVIFINFILWELNLNFEPKVNFSWKLNQNFDLQESSQQLLERAL